ncbi:MAG: valine--pyruvate transaminase [Gammaproteobacteria bacterium]|nr:valine--pyruvate transaminase [Gammaproteobacteria bacterium]
MKLSSFGEKYTGQSGIVDLMADLGEALHTNPNMISMGGGNPSRIPTVEEIYRDLLVNLLSAPNGTYNILGKYQPPQGDEQLLKQLAQLLRAEYGWPITDRNVAISNGGQSAFFVLSNLLAGKYTDGSIKQIRFPLVPEYLGYTDAGLETNFFSSTRPAIDIIDEHVYKYRVDFESLEVTDRTAALCVSRPTNPTGNVLTDNEVSQLDAIARESHVPLIIDGAYGAPFPNIIFERVTPHWNDNTILLLSLSKLGLPGVRTGFIVASEEMIHAYANANTILNLACGNVGPAIAGKLFEDREVLRIGSELIMPYYRDKAMRAMELVIEACSDLPMYVHKPEGAIFLWLWFKDLPVHSTQLYQLLKEAGVLIIPGHDSFAGLDEDWPHTHECIRVSYAQDEEQVKKGIEIIAREVRKLYAK